MIDHVRNPLVRCEHCGWVSFAVTRQEAEAEVASFNAWFETQTEEVKEMYGGKGSSLAGYRCQRCGRDRFRRGGEDLAEGHTIGPVLWEMKPEFLSFLLDNGYMAVVPVPGFRWVGMMKFAFTTAIIVGNLDDYDGYSDRWCYHTTADAAEAYAEWGGRQWTGEPTGWHRHPSSGRRAGPDHELEEALKEL